MTFPPGVVTGTVSVPTTPDELDEDPESLTVDLIGPANAGIADGSATVTINDDDPTPTLSVNNADVDEATPARSALPSR